ncbi:MAG TPA: hypothetical protein DHV31_03010, partial [Clostridiales bacterium]|nr:hypothetical protein [Clostridiales bacterium]
SDCTKIRGYAFYGGAGFTTFTVPASVTKVDRYAFQNCTDLETLYWNAVDGEMAMLYKNNANLNCFYGCNSLSEISFGEGVMTVPYNIGSQLSSLTSVSIPASVKWIRNNAFYNCVNLENVTIADGSILQSIGSEAFQTSGITTISFPNTLTSLPSNAFSYCSNLTSITIPKTMTYIQGTAFMSCPALESITVDAENTVYDTRSGLNALIDTSTHVLLVGSKNSVIPDDVVAIADFAFYGSGITEIIIPGNVKTIGEQAFRACASLTDLTISDGVEVIKSYAFANCTALETLILPDSVTTVSGSAFYHCDALQTVRLSGGLTNLADGAFNTCENLDTVYIENAYAYTGATDVWALGWSLLHATNVYVSASVYEDVNNTNDFLTDEANFTQPTGATVVEGRNYYLFIKKVS